eukprot:2097857-Prymnesium_polylepis.1
MGVGSRAGVGSVTNRGEPQFGYVCVRHLLAVGRAVAFPVVSFLRAQRLSLLGRLQPVRHDESFAQPE